MSKNLAKEYVKDFRKMLIDFIQTDDIEAARRFFRIRGIAVPKKDLVLKLGLYKAAQDAERIPVEIKRMAAEKCLKMGFKPFNHCEYLSDNHGLGILEGVCEAHCIPCDIAIQKKKCVVLYGEKGLFACKENS